MKSIILKLDFTTVSAKYLSSVALQMVEWSMNIYNATAPLSLDSDIVGLSLKDSSTNAEIPVKNLKSSIKIEIPILPSQASNGIQFSCIYFSESTQKWSNEGCVLSGIQLKPGGNFVAVCLCNHLTDFSISAEFTSLFANSGFQYFDDIGGAFSNGKISSLKGNRSFFYKS
jgi:GPCR proteolysis site, GPS, motif